MGWLAVADAMQAVIQPALDALDTAPWALVFSGWPDPSRLLQELRSPQRRAAISIFPAGSRNVSRYTPEPTIVKVDATETITINSGALTATLGGAPRGKDNVFLFPNHVPLGYHVGGSDTLASIAAGLADLVNASSELPGVSASAVGPVVTLAGPLVKLAGGAFGYGTVRREASRILRRMQVTVWAQTPTDRELIVSTMEAAFGVLSFLTLADTAAARILYDGGMVDDVQMPSGLLREVVFFQVEYPVFLVEDLARVAVVDLALSVNDSLVGDVLTLPPGA